MLTEVTGPATAEVAIQGESDMRVRPKAKRNKARKPVKGKTEAKAPKVGSKLAKIEKLLRREEGCTAADVLKACNWPAVSMPQQARALGVRLKTAKEGRITRYWAA